MPELPDQHAPRSRARLSGARARLRPFMRRPTLVLLVYGLCLVLVAITASAQARVISEQYQAVAIASMVRNDATLVRAVVNSVVQVADLPPAGPTAARQAELAAVLRALVERAGIVRVELRAADGSPIAAHDGMPAGTRLPASTGFEAAAAGEVAAELVTPPAQAGVPAAFVREDLPLVAGEAGTVAVMTIWRDASPILATVDAVGSGIVTLTLTAAVILAVLLTFVFHTAQVRINRQTADLVEATRRDPVTGLLNHGAVVDRLQAALLRSRLDAESVAVALVDIDNFRLVNESYGYEAGDEALALVATRLQEAAPPGAVLGRYGPDELLVWARGRARDLLPAIEAARAAMSTLVLRQVDGDGIPVTISVGLAESPGDAAGVTELLARAAQTLASAKAGGGDSIRLCLAEVDAADARTFDVFQGLVIAIDTKDRYTKRHSEDVARYGMFIADLLDLDAEMRRAVRMAGLLHDVGKIGIPDGILRKPGRLSASEASIVEQHVALGDMIVRDLPGIDMVRAGVRHHHERWDGRGYLHRLAGDDIPLIARILSVGDTFSAMTTTRPYRRALPVREALVRLLDAAGTQLDESIVTTFVTGMERHPSAPIPGSPAAALWTPGPVAAPAEVAA